MSQPNPTETPKFSPNLAVVFTLLGITLACILAAPSMFTGQSTWFARDYGSQIYPFATYVKYSWLHGHIPLWDPYNLNGIPFMAQWNTLVFYPGSLIYILTPVVYGLPLFIFLHLLLAGWGFFKVAHSLTQNSLSSAITAFSYAFCGITLSFSCYPAHIAAYALAPIILWRILEYCPSTSLRNFGLALIPTSLQLLTGSPEIILFTWLTLITTVLIRNRSAIFKIALLLSSCLGLTAFQFIPFLVLFLNSHRTGNTNLDWALNPIDLPGFLVSQIHSTTSNFGFMFSGANQFLLLSYYVPLGLLFSGIALTSRDLFKRQPLLAGYGFLVLLGGILATGDRLPIIASCIVNSPLAVIRFPIKFIILTTIALHLVFCLLLASNLRLKLWKPSCFLLISGIFILKADPTVIPNYLFHASIGLCIVGLYYFRTGLTQAWLLSSVIMLLIVDTSGLPKFPTLPIRQALPVAQAFPRPTLGQGRIQRMNWPIDTNLVQDTKNRANLMSRNINLLTHTPSAGGFFSMFLTPANTLANRMYDDERLTNSCPSLCAFLGISVSQENTQLISNSNHTPMVQIGKQTSISQPTNWLNAILTADLQTIVVLTNPVPAWADTTARISNFKISEESLAFDYTASTNTIVTIAQSYYPAWQAQVDQQKAQLFRINYAFTGMLVPAGQHHVILSYVDKGLRLGTTISLLTGLSLGLVYLSRSRKSSAKNQSVL